MSGKVQAGGILRKSKDVTWRTPRLLRERVRTFFEGCDDWLDPAAPPDNPLEAPRFYCGPTPSRVPTQGPLFGEPTEEEANRLDGLHEPWDAPWYCNPPFKREWYERALSQVEARPGQPGLLLLPVNRTEETYCQELLEVVSVRLFVRWPEPKSRGRIPFESSVDGAEVRNNPFASWVLRKWAERGPGGRARELQASREAESGHHGSPGPLAYANGERRETPARDGGGIAEHAQPPGCGSSLADADRRRLARERESEPGGQQGPRGDVAHGRDLPGWVGDGPLDRGGWWTSEPDVGRVAHGVASRVDRLRATGNGVVPAVAARAWLELTGRALA